MRATASWLWPKILSVLLTTRPTSRPMMASTTRISRRVKPLWGRPARGKEERKRIRIGGNYCVGGGPSAGPGTVIEEGTAIGTGPDGDPPAAGLAPSARRRR